MVGADHPQRILAAQPLVTDHDILQRVVERVADMEAAGHIGRRVDDGEGFGIGAFRPEQAVFLPMGVPFRLDCGGIESRVELLGHIARPLASALDAKQSLVARAIYTHS